MPGRDAVATRARGFIVNLLFDDKRYSEEKSRPPGFAGKMPQRPRRPQPSQQRKSPAVAGGASSIH